MTSQFEFETIPWTGEAMSQEGEFGGGNGEWESEYLRGRRPPMRLPTRPALPQRPIMTRPRWPVRPPVAPVFPMVPWGAWPPSDEPLDNPPAEPSADAFEPIDSEEVFAFETRPNLTARWDAKPAAADATKVQTYGGRSPPDGPPGRTLRDATPLPGAAACGFNPAKHAFRFANSFDFPPALINALKKLPFRITLGSRRMGLCGGVSLLAADYCSFGMQVPRQSQLRQSRTTSSIGGSSRGKWSR
jgi:hypothetical protein